MYLKRIIITSALITFTFVFAFGQGFPNTQKGNKSNASYAAPRQLGNIPVNFATGAPNVNIPIWTAKSGNLSFPVSLSYSTNGVRVFETPSIVGLSWKLNTGGEIIQIIRGIDDLGNAETSTPPINHDSINNPSNVYLMKILKGKEDSETDLYLVNSLGFSGTFFYDSDGTIQTINKKSDVKIEHTYNRDTWYDVDKHKCKITADDGTQYYFSFSICFWNDATFESDSYFRTVNYAMSLNKIVSANNCDSIIINYSQYPYYTNYGQNIVNLSRVMDKSVNTNIQYTSYYAFHIQSIETNNESIFFDIQDVDIDNPEYDSPYQGTDDNPGGIDKVLTKITIKDKLQTEIKTFDFEYEITDNNRIFLKELKESSPTDNTLPPYVFNYMNIDNLSDVYYYKGIDFWGFQKMGSSPIYDYQVRFPNENMILSGMLSEISYPLGGSTTYEYEINRYNCSNDGSDWYNEDWNFVLDSLEDNCSMSFNNRANMKGPGVRLKKIIDFGTNNNHITELKYEDEDPQGTSISYGRLSYYPFLHFYNPTTEYNYFSSNTYGIESGFVTYEKVIIFDGGENSPQTNTGINGKKEYNFSIEPPEENDNFLYSLNYFNRQKNGLPIKTVVFDNENDTLTENKNNFLTDSNNNVFSRNLKIILKNVDDSSFYQSYYNIYQNDIKLNSTLSKTYATSNNNVHIKEITNYLYERNGQQYINPTQKTQTLSNGDIITTEFYYPRDFSGEIFEIMLERNIKSQIIEKKIKNNGIIVSASKNNYIFKINDNDTIIVLDNIQIWENGAYKTITWFDKHDKNGQMLEYHGVDGMHNAVLYAYNNTLPVAYVSNAYHKDIFYTSFEEEWANIITGDAKTGNKSYNSAFYFDFPEYFGTFTLSYWKKTANNWEYVEQELQYSQNGHTINDGQIDEVRVYPKNAFMSTVTYKPLIGKTSETDANGISVYYEYDDFGRLIKIYDQDKKLIRETEYHINNN